MSYEVTKGATVKVAAGVLLAGAIAVWGASAAWNGVTRDMSDVKKEQGNHKQYEQAHSDLRMGIQHLMTLQETGLRHRGIRVPRRPNKMRDRSR